MKEFTYHGMDVAGRFTSGESHGGYVVWGKEL